MEAERERRGSWVIATLLLGSVVVTVGTPFALVRWRRERAREQIFRNERLAGASIEMIATAQADFRANDRDHNGVPDFWTANVNGLWLHGQLIESGIAQADATPPAYASPVPYHGYLIVAMEFDDSESPPVDYRIETDKTAGKVHHPSRFGFCAYPAEYGVTGRWTAIINQDNSMFWIDNGGKPVLRWPSEDDLKRRYCRKC